MGQEELDSVILINKRSSMNIQIENFILKPCQASPEKWDLIEIVQRTRESDGVLYDDYNDIGFGMTLEYAKRKIIGFMLAKDTRTVNLKTFEQELDNVILKLNLQNTK